MRVESALPPGLPSSRWRAGLGGLLARERLVILCVTALCVSLALPLGFSGWDDLHYLRAAQSWLAEGVHAPGDHWATRLPYVLTLALSLRVFGPSATALTVPNAICFLLILALVWRIARHLFGEAAAFWSAFAAAATPLLLRMPTTYYPEAMEVALGLAAAAFVLAALAATERSRMPLLLAAGLAGGLSILVRQTSIALAPALALLLVLETSADRRRAIGHVLQLAGGFAIPVLLEMLFYLVLTGHPLERLRIDSRHVLIPSVHLRGGTFDGGSPLFNWRLAARWDVPSLISLHWTINPLLRLFTSPGLLLTPFLCVGGGILVMRAQDSLARSYTLFALCAVLLQYGLNTFVLVIAPDTRYMLQSLSLALPLAGLLLSRLPPRGRRPLAIVGMALPAVAALAIEPSPARLMPALERLANRGVAIHVSPNMLNAADVLTQEHPALGRALIGFRNGTDVPVGGLAVVDPYGWAAGLSERCGSGEARWLPLEQTPPQIGAWDVGPLVTVLPPAIVQRIETRAQRLVLVRRLC